MEALFNKLSPVSYADYCARPWGWSKCCYTLRLALAPPGVAPIMQASWSFLFAFALAPFKPAALLYIVSLIVYEVVVLIACGGALDDSWGCSWSFRERAVVVVFSIMGYALGRALDTLRGGDTTKIWLRAAAPALIGAFSVAFLSIWRGRMVECVRGDYSRSASEAFVVLFLVYITSLLLAPKENK